MKKDLKTLLKEAITILGEDIAGQAPQQSPQAGPTQPTAGNPQQTPPATTDPNSPTQPQQNQPMDPNANVNANIDSLIEQLNIIRSGKSFGEPSIYKAVSDMYDGIDPQKKATVQEVIKQIADTLTQASANISNQDQPGEMGNNQDAGGMLPTGTQQTAPNQQGAPVVPSMQPQQPVI